MDVDVSNRAGLPADRLDALRADLSLLEKVRSGLGERAFRYAVDGEEGDVLIELAASADAGEALQLACTNPHYGRHDDPVRRAKKIFADLHADPAFFVRIAEVYEAASRASQQRKLSGQPLGLPDWLEVFLLESTNHRESNWSAPVHASKLDAAIVERMLELKGLPRDFALRTALAVNPKDWNAREIFRMLGGLRGFADAFARHTSTASECLAAASAEQRVQALELLEHLRAAPVELAECLVGLGVSSSKRVREAAVPVLRRMGKPAIEAIQARAATGSNDERAYAAGLLWTLTGEASRPFLKERLDAETSAKVKQAIASLLATPDADSAGAPPELPPVSPVDRHAPLGEETFQALRALFDKNHHELLRQHDRHGGGGKSAKSPDPTGDAQVREVLRRLTDMHADDPALQMKELQNWHMNGLMLDFVKRPELMPVHAVRVALLMNFIGVNKRGQTNVENEWQLRQLFDNYTRTHPDRADLRQVAAAFDAVGVDHRPLARATLNTLRWQGGGGVQPERVWAYFAEHPDVLDEVFNLPKDYHTDQRRANVFGVLAHFPHLPPKWLTMMWDLALTGPKKERPLAQACLDKVSGKAQRILAALSDGKADTRAIAAEWLARVAGDNRDEAIKALKAALKKEKQEVAAGAMMNALERLGVPIDQFVNLDNLAADARKFLAKGPPANLKWFKFDLLPKVHWAQSGKPVDPDVLQYLIANACKLGNPEPGPTLRRYCSYFRKPDAEELGQHVLTAWVGHDTVGHTHDQAHEHARKAAAQMAQLSKQYPQFYPAKDEAQWYQDLYRQKLNEPVGTAQKEKGILAVAAACCGGRAAPVAAQYLKTWYGQRAHQCKALLHMLAYVEHPSAIQVLLATSARFRTASIRKEAEQLVTALADRKGWTLDELADRTIPTGGFDEDRQLVIDYGPRKFTARLDDDLNVTLTGEDGKAIKSLPDARQGEDEQQVKEAKKLLSNAKKEITSLLKMQKERLYEAMCTQRSWPFADWDAYLNKHPIAKRYLQRLVWTVVDEHGKPTQTFRPMEDGSLTDTNDEAVTVPTDARIRLAHAATIPEAQTAAWRTHFADYDVDPLFEQFAAAPYVLTPERKDSTDVEDFNGHMLDAFKLRARMTKAGYTRGQAEDGGWFYLYKKHFPSLGVEAVIEFSGNGLPETDRPVALRQLYFCRTGRQESGYSYDAEKLALGDVPPVLLAECYNDLKSAAAQGAGYDPEWEKKAYN